MPVIDELMRAFERGDLAQMNALTSDDLDLRIDHYRDETDVAWQRCANRGELHALLGRLATEVFPKGTHILSLETEELIGGWTMTALRQRFFYAVRGREVVSQTWIIAHESYGRCDYFRETVATIEDVQAG